MSIARLVQKRVEKVWGRRDLPEMFGGDDPGAEPLGEIWFEHPDDDGAELLVKYLFTSEKLSIQVHPDDAAAKRAGLERGKEEAWVILRAEPDATIGLGLRHEITREQLREAALDGSIEELIDWRPARAGDVLYSPAGTIHALGPGLVLIEVQQNTDVTYRLYDYGRPRELHLDAGIEVARREPYSSPMEAYVRPDGREILAEGRAFVLERMSGTRSGGLNGSKDRPVWLIPVRGSGWIDEQELEVGSVWYLDEPASVSLGDGSVLLLAYAGGAVNEQLVG